MDDKYNHKNSQHNLSLRKQKLNPQQDIILLPVGMANKSADN